MKTYRLTRTATVVQYKHISHAADANDEDIIEAAWDIPWKEAKVINSDGIEVERD